jgi:Spy/CpxP family protein refolding chaperone
MKRGVGHALLLLATGTAMAQAQEVRTRAPRAIPPIEAWARVGGRIMVPMGMGTVENVLRRKDELKLTDQQVTQIEALRREEVTRRQNEARDLIDLQSRASAGLIERTTFRDEMEKIEDAQRLGARNVRNRLEQILTDEQRAQLPWRGFPIEHCCGWRALPGERAFPFDRFDAFDWMNSHWLRTLDATRPRFDTILRSYRGGGIL